MEEIIEEKINNDNERQPEITWTDFEGRWVKLDEGEARVMLLANPGQVDKEYSGETVHAVEFDVLELDGHAYVKDEKIFSTSSKKLLTRLKPIVEKIQKNGPVKVSITRVGDKFDTNYLVKEVQ